MDKIIIQANNEVKFEKNKINDERLRFLDNKLFHINKKIEMLSQNIFIQNREIKDIHEYNKKHPYKIARYLKKFKILVIKSLLRIPYLKFKYYTQKKIGIENSLRQYSR